MLNPKLIEMYGEESRVLFEKLIEYLGSTVAPQVGVLHTGFTVIDGAKFPKSFVTNIKRQFMLPEISNFMGNGYIITLHGVGLYRYNDEVDCDPLLIGDDVKRLPDLADEADSIMKEVGIPGLMTKAVEDDPSLLNKDVEYMVCAGLMNINCAISLDVAKRILSVAGSPLMGYNNGHKLADWVMRKLVEDYIPGSKEVVEKYDDSDKIYYTEV